MRGDVLLWFAAVHVLYMCRAFDGMVLSLAVPFAEGSLLSSCVMDEVRQLQLATLQTAGPE
jgi:hypothetical protein